MVKTLKGAIRKAKQKALADVYGFSDPFSAIEWLKTLPKEWQSAVEDVIIQIYHTI